MFVFIPPRTAIDAQALLKKAVALDRIVSLIGESELSTDDQKIYKRAKMLKNYMTQNFTVVETQTEKKGVFVEIKDTVNDVKAILDGKVDVLIPEDLLYIATLKDVANKLSAKTAEEAKKANETVAQTQTNQIAQPTPTSTGAIAPTEHKAVTPPNPETLQG
jgi:cell pole-organizing protein PopZ